MIFCGLLNFQEQACPHFFLGSQFEDIRMMEPHHSCVYVEQKSLPPPGARQQGFLLYMGGGGAPGFFCTRTFRSEFILHAVLNLVRKILHPHAVSLPLARLDLPY